MIDEANEHNFKVTKLRIYEDLLELMADIQSVNCPDVLTE